MPANTAMLSRIGLSPDLLVDRGVAVPRYASRFANWDATGVPLMVAEGKARSACALPPHHLWLRAATAGPIPGFAALFPATAIAMASGPITASPHAEPALHLDPARMMQALAATARAVGVVVLPRGADLVAVERAGTRIEAIALADGTRLIADLFVDASGPGAGLVDPPTAPREDWRSTLPATKLLLQAAPTAASPGFIDEYRATEDGWQAAWPRARGLAFGDRTDDAAISRAAPTAAWGGIVATAPGRLIDGWSGNLLALGEAAAQPGPLGLLGLPITLGQLSLALELLPDRDMEPLLIAEYNRRAGAYADEWHDYAAAHYHACRAGGTFWQTIANAPLSARLRQRYAQFARRGMVATSADQPVERDAWAALLLAGGRLPTLTDPVALGVSPEAARRAVLQLAREGAATAGAGDPTLALACP
jgi:tryptophan halogenase